MSDPKKSAWDSYRRWRGLAWISTPVAVYLVTKGGDAYFPLTLALIMISAAALIGIEFFDCPKCDQTFFYVSGFATKYSMVRFGGHHPFAQTCVHCGFPKWEEPPEKTEAYPPCREKFPRPDSANVEQLRLENFLTLVLRDDPGAIGLRLDPQGWADADHLVARANRYDVKLTRESLGDIASGSEDHQFDWNPVGNRVRFTRG